MAGFFFMQMGKPVIDLSVRTRIFAAMTPSFLVVAGCIGFALFKLQSLPTTFTQFGEGALPFASGS